MKSLISDSFLFTRNLLFYHFSGVLCYHLHCGELYGERVSPLRPIPLLYAGDSDSLAQRSCNLWEGVLPIMPLFTHLTSVVFYREIVLKLTHLLLVMPYTGVCQLPWVPDRLQSHTFRRREQSGSAWLWELPACGAQVALHANKSELSSCIFLGRTWKSVLSNHLISASLLPGFSPLLGDGRLHPHSEHPHRAYKDSALLPQGSEPGPSTGEPGSQDLR